MPYSNYQGLTLVTAPTAFPVSVADAKKHGRVFHNLDDSLIAGYISMATRVCEHHSKRAFLPQTWRLALEQWPGRNPSVGYREAVSLAEYQRFSYIELPKPPLRSIISFTYTDVANNTFNMTQGFDNTVGNYILDLEPEPGCVRLPFAGIWPTTILLPGSPIKITYSCGYDQFTGSLRVDDTGAATLVSGDNFVPSMIGSFITVGADPVLQRVVIGYSSPTSIQLDCPYAVNDAPVPYSANNVPMPLRGAILFMAQHLYENREPIVVGRSVSAIEVPGTIDAMIEPYKIRRSG